MIYSLARTKVTDSAAFRKAFDANKSARKAAGASGTEQVYTDLDNSNNVSVVLEWDNVESARRFYQDPKLKAVLAAGTTIGDLDVRYLNRI